ncbi:hypothetical protein CC78DRAFT_586931 [Lojkania enalia]|uniref:Uncharacterized protein n=1 Tax=Lojkania enalia TaxID=147567 RepID=A0A9P4JY29_9PLEO|nr:hypothetical protein CC78DRAFT_586931 [Didymosphaeria enalia]
MWTDLLLTLLLLQSIAVQSQLPPVPKSARFTQIVCNSATGSRNNQIALFDRDGKPLGAVDENCSLISGPCKVEGFSDITVGPYTVKHPGAIFGPCAYTDVEMEITATDGFNTVNQLLFATCKVSPFPCVGDPEKPTIGTLNEVIISEFPSDFKPTSIVLREYNKDGCPVDQNFGDEISNAAGCNLITNTGITNVVVIPKPDMPSTCVLTLYDDRNCFSTSNAEIGPITPGSDPSACIGPIRNSKGDVFEAKAAMLKC